MEGRCRTRPDKVTILYPDDHQCHVRLDQPYPAHVTASWYGDSAGHYEGDTPMIDAVGIKVGRFSMIDWYGTRFTDALQVVERTGCLIRAQRTKR